MKDNELDGYDSAPERHLEYRWLQRFPQLKRFRRYLFWIAVAMIVLGTVGIGRAALLSVTSVIFFGALFIAGGVLKICYAIQGREELLWSGLAALCYLLIGGVILYDPIGSTIALTWLLGGFLVAIGTMRSMLAIRIRTVEPRWLWVLVSGALSIVLGCILFGAGVNELWFIGLMIALELLFDGFGLLFIALSLRDIEKNIKAQQ